MERPATQSTVHLHPALGERVGDLIHTGRVFFKKGWVPATGGNFSMRPDACHIAITRSGRHKGELGRDDFLVLDLDGNLVHGDGRPSAETDLHLSLYRRFRETGCVLHTHSPRATVLSERHPDGLTFEGMEILKAFRGVHTHETQIRLPVFPNDQDIPRLARAVERYLDSNSGIYGYLIRGHGLYAWGETVAEARRHVEAFEFLFECEVTRGGR